MRSSSAAAAESLKKMHKRGIRVLPGGDYGFAFTPHCQNARDLEYFVKYLGFTPMEAILSATRLGAAIMMKGEELGQIRKGAWPTSCWSTAIRSATSRILRDPRKMLAVMKDGVFYKETRDRLLHARAGRSPSHDPRNRSEEGAECP